MDERPTISTHVLDTQNGAPARGIEVVLFRQTTDGDELQGGAGTTDADGRIRHLLEVELEPGEYVIEFKLDGPFFGTVALTFTVGDATRSYHVPLLVAPYSVASYRGS
jgi:5-hydroxyisourate hydrolase